MEKFKANEAKKLSQGVIDERKTKRNEEDLKAVYTKIKDAASNGYNKVTIDKALDKWIIDELKADGYGVEYGIDINANSLIYGLWKTVKTIISWG